MPLNDLLFNITWIFVYVVVLIAFFGLVINRLIAMRRNSYIKSEQYNLTFLQIKVPAQNEVEIESAEHFFANLTGFRRTGKDALFKGQFRISFEIVSKNDGIGFYVVVPDELVNLIEKQINGAYPMAEIDVVDPKEVWDRGSFTAIAELKLSGTDYYPIKTYKDLENSDPVSAITSALSKLKDDEVIALQYIISPADESWRNAGNAFIGSVKAKKANTEKHYNVDDSVLEGIEKKIGKSGFDVTIRIVSIAADSMSAESHLRNVATSFEQFTNVKYNRFKKVASRFHSRKRMADRFIYRQNNTGKVHIPLFNITLHRTGSVLNTEEMATIFHFPNKNVQTPNIMWLEARKSAAPSNLPTEGVYLGKNIFRNTEKKVFMREDDRKRHLYIIGQTGTGKSEFMKTLAIQDIKNGEGLAFIDPHGSDIDDILQKIPPERIDDVILFDASDFERPLGLNLLEAHTEEERHMMINSFIALLYKLYDPNRQGIMGPQLERSIRNLMLTAMVDPESTLVDVLRLLIDQDYIKQFLPKITDPLVKRFWTDEIAKTSDFHKSEKLGYFVSKFDKFVTDTTMRRILGQPKSAINFDQIMEERKVLLVDLSKGKIGEENSNFLGLLLVPRILAAALARAAYLGKKEFPNFYLYVDEFQNFATPDFATILSEARKYKLNLTVAHQFIAQLDDDIKEAVFGNVGTMVSFRVGIDDAEYLEQQFEPTFTQSDLINNPVGNAYMKLLVNGQPSVPFSLKVDWDMVNATPKRPDIEQEIRKRSREKYGRSAAEVEEFIYKRAGFKDEPAEEEKAPPKRLLPF